MSISLSGGRLKFRDDAWIEAAECLRVDAALEMGSMMPNRTWEGSCQKGNIILRNRERIPFFEGFRKKRKSGYIIRSTLTTSAFCRLGQPTSPHDQLHAFLSKGFPSPPFSYPTLPRTFRSLSSPLQTRGCLCYWYPVKLHHAHAGERIIRALHIFQ